MNKMTFEQVMDAVVANGLKFETKDGELNVRAECFTDDKELIKGEAFFDVFADWDVTAASPISDAVIWGLCKDIEIALGGRWCYNAANNAIEQMDV